MNPRVVAIIQARMGSSRLPGKVLLDIGGEPMLARVVERTRLATEVEEVLVATTTDASDTVVADFCSSRAIPCTRGSQYDVLDRYWHAASAARAEVVVRVTADCPLIDPGLIDDVVATLLGRREVARDGVASSLQSDFDFVANRLPPPARRTFPIGLDTEACTASALERAWNEARQPEEREHVMPYLYAGVNLSSETSPCAVGTSSRGFRVAVLNHVPDLGNYRWTVDTVEDLDFVRQVYQRLGDKSDFSWHDVLALLEAEPELTRINAAVKHKSLHDVDRRMGQ